jgi:hypothetical protein
MCVCSNKKHTEKFAGVHKENLANENIMKSSFTDPGCCLGFVVCIFLVAINVTFILSALWFSKYRFKSKYNSVNSFKTHDLGQYSNRIQ